MKRLFVVMVFALMLMAAIASQTAFACQGEDCWSWTDANQWFRQGGWVNDGALKAWEKEKQSISGGANCGSAEIIATQAGLNEFKNEFTLPSLVIKQEGAQFMEDTSAGKVEGSGEFSAANTAKQKTITETTFSDDNLLTKATDLQKAKGDGWARHAEVSTDLNMIQFTEYNAVATNGSWETEHYGARIQEIEVNGTTKKGSFWFEVKQTSDGSTNTYATDNKMVGAMNQSNSTAAAGRKIDVTVSQTRLDTYSQTLTKPGFTGTQSGGILSSTSVNIKK